jgi:hypothetical protein
MKLLINREFQVAAIVLLVVATTVAKPGFADQRIVGSGSWETTYQLVHPDGTLGGLLRQRYASEMACIQSRNGIVQAAQASYEGLDQHWEPSDPEWQAMEAQANLTPCANINTGRVSGYNVANGFPHKASSEFCVDMTRANSCAQGSAESQEMMDILRQVGETYGLSPQEIQQAADMIESLSGSSGDGRARLAR